MTCHVEFDEDETVALLDLINRHYRQYGVSSQGLLMRITTKLRDAAILADA